MSVEREYLAVPSLDLQKKVQEFTLSERFWTAYPADKIEHILRYYKLLPDRFYYAGFNAETNEAMFVGPPQITGAGLPQEYEMLPADDKFLRLPPSKDALILDPPSGKVLPPPSGNDDS